MKNKKIHSFSRPFAKEHSVNEAAILKFIAYKVRENGNEREGRLWYYGSIKDIAASIPYISASAIDANLVKMEKKGLVEFSKYNKWPEDRTRWYHVPQPFIDDVEKKTLKFNSDVAVNHGIPAAVILENLRYWLRRKLKKSTGIEVSHEMSPTKLKTVMPFSEAAIKKALADLVKAEVIVKTSATKPEYSLPPDEMMALRLTVKLKN